MSQIFEGLKTRAIIDQAERHDLVEKILDYFPDMIHSVNENGEIVYVNKKSEELVGLKAEELIGKSIYEIYHPSLHQEVKSGLVDLKKKGIKKVRSQVRHKNGTPIDVEIRSLSLYNERDQFVKTFSVIRDISETNQLKRQLIQSEKLATIGEFSAGIMHDIKNPVMVIIGMSELIASGDLKDPNTIIEYAKRIKNAGDKIATLSDHMRGFVRSDIEKLSTTDFGNLLEEAFPLVESRLQSLGITMTNNLKGKNITLLCRPNQIEQVFINLISNACDVLKDSPQRFIEVSGTKFHDSIQITFEDSGPGVKKEISSKIFDSFFTTKPKGEGTGLGLSISKGIIGEHGGTIEITRSKKLGGASFIIKIPTKMPEE